MPLIVVLLWLGRKAENARVDAASVVIWRSCSVAPTYSRWYARPGIASVASTLIDYEEWANTHLVERRSYGHGVDDNRVCSGSEHDDVDETRMSGGSDAC